MNIFFKILAILTTPIFFVVLRSSAQQSSFIDNRDGRPYKTVKIGNQVWMAENLAYLPQVGPPDNSGGQDAVKKPFYYVYGYHGDNVAEAKKNPNYLRYGVLYTWNAAKNACPPGWHLPSDEEWKELEKNLGMSKTDVDEKMFRLSGNVGLKLKSKSIWKIPGSNEVEFAAIPGGFRFSGNPGVAEAKGDFANAGETAYFWTSSVFREGFAYRRSFVAGSNASVRFIQMFSHAYSVRCIKD